MPTEDFIRLSSTCYVHAEYAEAFGAAQITNIDTVFDFQGDANLVKENLARHRTRIKFTLPGTSAVFFLKRYNRVPVISQLKNWFCHRKIASTAAFDYMPASQLEQHGIQTPKTIAYGYEWSGLFEKRSFMVMSAIEGHSLEEQLPECFDEAKSEKSYRLRCRFIDKLADFVKAFHDTGFRHRDLYLCHIFMTGKDTFHLIDLHRAFKPGLLSERYRLKDLTQLHYSSPGRVISQSDRLRFYLRYRGKTKIDASDRKFLRKIRSKAWTMALHDMKHSRPVPFAM